MGGTTLWPERGEQGIESGIGASEMPRWPQHAAKQICMSQRWHIYGQRRFACYNGNCREYEMRIVGMRRLWL